MKTIKYLAAIAMGIAAVSCNQAPAEGEGTEVRTAEVAPKALTAKDCIPGKSEVDSVSYLLGINFGTFLKGYNFGEKLNYAQIERGMKDFLKAEGDMYDADFGKQFKIDPQEMNDVFNNYLEKRMMYMSLVNKEAGEKFLSANAKKPGVQTTPSGLQYKIISAGGDLKPTVRDTVWVNYRGSLVDGTVFDETPEGSEPVNFVLGQVIPGWQEGMQLIGEGGSIELYIPSALGYGERGNQAIEPNSTLIFSVTLEKVGKVIDE